MEVIVLFNKSESVQWIANIIAELKDQPFLKMKVLGIGNFKVSQNARVRKYSLVNKLASIQQGGKHINWHKPVEIPLNNTAESVEDINLYVKQFSNPTIVWLGDTVSATALNEKLNLPIVYLDQVSSSMLRQDSAYCYLSGKSYYTPYWGCEIDNGLTKRLAYSISTSHAYSLWEARNSYSTLPGLMVRTMQVLAKRRKPFVEPEWQIKPNFRTPRIGQLIIGLMTHLIEKANEKIFKRNWYLLLYKLESELNPKEPLKGKSTRMSHHNTRFALADPFIVSYKNSTYVFAEAIDDKWFGHLVGMRIDENRQEQFDVLKQDYHLSYPFIFEWKEEWYMIPESSKNKTVDLFKCTSFPTDWIKEKTLIDQKELVDSTIIQYKGTWWMFANGKKYASTFNEEMHLFYADHPDGEWKPHPLNPIKNDIRLTRCAGKVIEHEGELFRPVQDCSRRYGYQVIWTRIIELTTESFLEMPIQRLNPKVIKGGKALHTINSTNKYAVIDGY